MFSKGTVRLYQRQLESGRLLWLGVDRVFSLQFLHFVSVVVELCWCGFHPSCGVSSVFWKLLFLEVWLIGFQFGVEPDHSLSLLLDEL